MAKFKRNTLIPLLMCASGLCAGCEVLPPNNFRILTTEPAGAYPLLIHMQQGTFYEARRDGVALLESPAALLFFDWRGSANRVRLLFRDGQDVALYERIGEWPLLAGVGDDISRPHGVQAAPEGNQLRGSIDVFVARSEKRDVDTSFEHYPRALRIVGYYVLPEVPQAADAAAAHPLMAFLPPRAGRPDRHSPGLVAFTTGEPGGLFGDLNRSLPPLPLIDVRYLVPNSLAAAFKPVIP